MGKLNLWMMLRRLGRRRSCLSPHQQKAYDVMTMPSFKTSSKWWDCWACRFATIGAAWTTATSAVFRNGWADRCSACWSQSILRRRNVETTEQTDYRRTADRSRFQRRLRVQKSAMQTSEAALIGRLHPQWTADTQTQHETRSEHL